jgi:DNA polymerase delta subunit 1
MDKYYRRPIELSTFDAMEFQCVEWYTCDDTRDDESPQVYTIRCFGVNSNGNSVCCSFTGFNPFFYIKVDMTYTRPKMKTYLSKLSYKIKTGEYYSQGLLIDKCEVVKQRDFYGYHGTDQFKFIKLVFRTQKCMRGYIYKIKAYNESHPNDYIRMYETNIDPLLKFYHMTGIQPSNWVSIEGYYPDYDISTCQINVYCDYTCVKHVDRSGNAPLLQASYDIETYSTPEIDENMNEFYPFPVPEKQSNVIYQIATCFKVLGSADFLVKHLLTLKKCGRIDDDRVVVWECKDERDLLMKWKRLIELMDPDILYQYNGDIFDCQYMVKRARMLNVEQGFLGVSRLLDTPASLVERTFSSSAYGTTNYQRLSIPGRINFDILIFIKREYKENSYKLDSVSEKYLGENKNDVSPYDIFRAYETGDPQSIQKIGEYCIQDTILPQKLVDVLHILQTQISMSNVTLVPIRYLIERGQEVKALSQISKNTQDKGFLLPHFEYNTSHPSYEGATVLEVEKPQIYNVPITVLDFASLYPSIIRAHNLCYSSIVLDRKYMNLQGVKYLRVKISLNDEPEHEVLYAQDTQTILPDLLAELGIQRKKYKKLMANEKDPLIREIYNKNQLAYKVSMNSIYGILGSRTIGCVQIAATVTKIGREMIRQTKEFIQNNHHCVYPEGHRTLELEDNQTVVVLVNGLETEVKVSEIQELIRAGKPVYIKTTFGWRQLYSSECLE